MLFFPVFLASYGVGIVFHELAHWLVGVAVGFRIQSVRIGAGASCFRRRFGDTVVDLRWFPVNGLVLTYPLVEPSRLALVVFFLAGIFGNIVLVAIAAALASGPAAGAAEVVGPGFVAAQAYLIWVSLIPVPTASGGTDSLKTFRVLRRGPAPAIAASTRSYSQRLAPYCGKAAPDVSRAAPCIIAGLSFIDAGTGLSRAVQLLSRELGRRDANNAERLLVIDALITREIIYRDLDLGPRLEGLLNLATSLGPDVATLQGSRGAVLVELGRYAEGKALLEPLAAGAPSFDAIISQLFLARAEHALGARDEALRLLETARAGIAIHPSDHAHRCVARTEEIMGVLGAPP